MSIHYRFTLLVALAALGACSSAPPTLPVKEDLTPRLTPLNPETKASYACTGSLPAVHRQICADDALALQDKTLLSDLRAQLQQLDLPGALVLEANQRQWMLSRAAHCGLSNETATTVEPDAQAIACLQSMYRQRSKQLNNWPAPKNQDPTKRHAWSTYAEFRVAEDRSAGFCPLVARAINQSLARDGRINFTQLPGAQLNAGSHASMSKTQQGNQSIDVALYEAGLYSGYQQRARGLSVNGQVVMDDRSLPRWIAEQPNYGGRAHASSSQTGDYGSIDVFTYKEDAFALVNETWGYYSPAARGESAYAGLYRLADKVTPVCLFQTYLTPPRTNTLRGLPVYGALADELNKLSGKPLPGYSQQDRQDIHQRWKERQWTLLNLPLLGVDQLQRSGREAAIRARHDAALERLFEWSERNVGAKHLYRQIMPMLQPAHEELVSMFAAQGLTAKEASSAADLLFHETLARALENLTPSAQPPNMPAAPFARYSPRYPIAPQAGALEQGRQFATLHSVLLNDAPLSVVSDFIAYETDVLGDRRGLGADGDTALMAAVGNPDAIRLLLDRGFDVNRDNAWGKTALMTAAQVNQAESAKRLLNAGADVHAQTQSKVGIGVGGPDRSEATSSPQTALLIAADVADSAMIELLVQAGALRKAWSGYDQQVCRQLESNQRLTQEEKEHYRGSELCANNYAPAPAQPRSSKDIRAGEKLVIRDGGTAYTVSLATRPAMTLFGRQLNLSPEQLQNKLSSTAVTVALAAQRKAGGNIVGPLNLVFDELTKNTPNQLAVRVSYPVEGGLASIAGYRMNDYPEQQVLTARYEPTQHTGEALWRALYSAAYTQGFKPTGKGYIVITSANGRETEYQLEVQDVYAAPQSAPE